MKKTQQQRRLELKYCVYCLYSFYYYIILVWPSLAIGYPIEHFSGIIHGADSVSILSITKKTQNGKIKAVKHFSNFCKYIQPWRFLQVWEFWLLIIQLLLRQSVHSARWVALLVSGGSPSFLSRLSEARPPTGPLGPPCSGDQSHQRDICLCLQGESLCQGD